VPGFFLHDELIALVDAGASPLQALQAATLNPARVMKRESDFGSIAAGKLADLLLLDANPLEDIRNTQRIAAVVTRGKLLSRRDLDALLENAEADANQR
jgi:imidazolonepropionase-like amidohydrolase